MEIEEERRINQEAYCRLKPTIDKVYPHGQYVAIVEMLISHGAQLPPKIWGGSDGVQDVLRAHGVPDEIESDA